MPSNTAAAAYRDCLPFLLVLCNIFFLVALFRQQQQNNNNKLRKCNTNKQTCFCCLKEKMNTENALSY